MAIDSDSTASDPATPTATRRANPYLRALVVLAAVSLAIAILAGLTVLSFQRADQDTGDTLTWAGIFGVVGFSFLLVWLLGSAITWKARD